MAMYKRGVVFLTFFGSCVSMAFLVAAISTKRWVVSSAKRSANPFESDGKIHFGLFEGRKELNVAYGWRGYNIDVIYLLKTEPDWLVYGFWLGTVTAVCGALLFSLISAIATTIITAKSNKTMKGLKQLYVWNFLSFVSSAAAICFWIAQYYLKIRYNVLTREDKENMWSSEGRAVLGYSFWFVVAAVIANVFNIVIVIFSNCRDNKSPMVQMMEEKVNGVIMLY